MGFTYFLRKAVRNSAKFSAGAADVFERLQRITTNEWVKIVFLVFLRELFVNFRTRLEQISKQFKVLWFPIKDNPCCCHGFGQLWYSVNVFVENGRIAVTCKLLKGQQNLIFFNCRWGVFAAKLWLTCRARLLLFSWRTPRGAVGNLFLNFCHYVRGLVRV